MSPHPQKRPKKLKVSVNADLLFGVRRSELTV
jgi:hypothetical protein